MPKDLNEWFYVAALYHWLGFFGVGLLGMFILFVATQVDLEGGHGIGGGMNAGLYAQQFADEQRLTRNERAERKSERKRTLGAVRYAQMVGLAFLIVGGGGFAYVQLYLGR
jgi:hypothetical protein